MRFREYLHDRDRQNTVERTIRPITLDRKNALFASQELGHLRLAYRDLQNERSQPPSMAGKHTYRYRQWAKTKPDRRSAPEELRQQGVIWTPLTKVMLMDLNSLSEASLPTNGLPVFYTHYMFDE